MVGDRSSSSQATERGGVVVVVVVVVLQRSAWCSGPGATVEPPCHSQVTLAKPPRTVRLLGLVEAAKQAVGSAPVKASPKGGRNATAYGSQSWTSQKLWCS
jgi:hypothetical protein